MISDAHATSNGSATTPYRTVVVGSWVFLAVFFALSAWYARHLDWNAARLAPALGAFLGKPIYPAIASGAITGHIYSPLGALAFSPIVWLPDVSAMMSAGSIMALAYFAMPFFLLARLARCSGGVSSHDAFAITAAALLLAVFDIRLRYAAVMVHAEAPAVGLGALAIVIAAATGPERIRGWGWAGAAAVCAALSKQTLLPTWLVLAAAAFLCSRACGGRFVVGSVAAAALSALFITWREDWESFLHNCIWIPAHHPWNTPGFSFSIGQPATGQNLPAYARGLSDVLIYLGGPWWPAFALAIWTLRGLRPSGIRAASPLARTALLAALAAAAQFPLALASFLKVGADVNAFAPLLTPLTLMMAALALQWISSANAGSVRPARALLMTVLIVLMGCNTSRLGFLGHAAFTRTDPNRAMSAFLGAHPGGEVYLPWNPLHTLVAEKRQDHFDYGVFDRALAGRPIAEEHYRSHLPPRLRFVVVRKTQSVSAHDMFRHHLPGLRPAESPRDLDTWMFFEAPPHPQPPALPPRR